MSDEYNQKNTPIEAQSSETMTGSSSGSSSDIDYVRPAELPEQDLYHGVLLVSGFFVRMQKLLECNIF